MPPPRSYLDRSARRLGAASRQSPQAWVASSTSIRPPGSKAILKGGPLRWGRITYKGRKPTVRARSEEIKALADQGMSMGAIAAKLGIGKGSVHRVLNPTAPAG
ncbi:helix-turn-helix domain-containing protein [Methylorubrum extorquens]|uniref:helix-turn-helix domain-containing protein n=1 Tax=Methylorubrum extorquens TaxID=408 RepID=UPI00315B1904